MKHGPPHIKIESQFVLYIMIKTNTHTNNPALQTNLHNFRLICKRLADPDPTSYML